MKSKDYITFKANHLAEVPPVTNLQMSFQNSMNKL